MNHLGTQTITTNRLTLRRWQTGDAGQLYANYGSDPRVQEYITWFPCATPELCEQFIEMNIQSYAEKPDSYAWAIVYEGELIGSIGAFNIDDNMRSCELGYSIGSRFWGRGIVTEAAQAVLDYLLGPAGFHRVFATYHEENAGSGRVMEKIGMRYEGRLRGATKSKDGSWADLLCYARLSTD